MLVLVDPRPDQLRISGAPNYTWANFYDSRATNWKAGLPKAILFSDRVLISVKNSSKIEDSWCSSSEVPKRWIQGDRCLEFLALPWVMWAQGLFCYNHVCSSALPFVGANLTLQCAMLEHGTYSVQSILDHCPHKRLIDPKQELFWNKKAFIAELHKQEASQCFWQNNKESLAADAQSIIAQR